MNADSKEKSSQDLAEDRTDWAEDRTLLANERTFAGWMRTGMACVALALGLKAVFGDFEPTWIAKAASSLFIAISIYIFVMAYIQSRKTKDRLTDNTAEAVGRSSMAITCTLLSIGSVATGTILWLL